MRIISLFDIGVHFFERKSNWIFVESNIQKYF